MRPASLRIGELAERLGTTPRTVRYYEEIGLLPASEGRAPRGHRLYGEADVERLERILELRRLLGLSLDELKEVVEAEEARAELRERFHRTEEPAERRRVLREALPYVERQLELVRQRARELDQLERELAAKRSRIRRRLRRLDAEAGRANGRDGRKEAR